MVNLYEIDEVQRDRTCFKIKLFSFYSIKNEQNITITLLYPLIMSILILYDNLDFHSFLNYIDYLVLFLVNMYSFEIKFLFVIYRFSDRFIPVVSYDIDNVKKSVVFYCYDKMD